MTQSIFDTQIENLRKELSQFFGVTGNGKAGFSVYYSRFPIEEITELTLIAIAPANWKHLTGEQEPFVGLQIWAGLGAVDPDLVGAKKYEPFQISGKHKGVKWEVGQYAGVFVIRYPGELETLFSIPGGIAGILEKCKQSSKPGMFAKSAHLSEQLTKYRKQGRQLSIFDMLTEPTKAKIKDSGANPAAIFEGVELTAAQHKLIDCICKILAEKSSTKSFEGNRKTNPGGAAVGVTFYEIAKEYYGNTPSGKNMKDIQAILNKLDTTRFLLVYTMKDKKPGGVEIERKIEEYVSLIRLQLATETVRKSGTIQSKKSEIIIHLHPIFRAQIEKKFVLQPVDVWHRIEAATGSRKVPETVYRLKEYLAREYSAKRGKPSEIGQEKLFLMLHENLVNQGRGKRGKEYFLQAVEVCKKIGLLESYTVVSDRNGEPKYQFTLSKNWT